MSSYTYQPLNPSSSPPKQYAPVHSMSSAFSASANPNEDWTKISDLAERRRIQNRIAQRNYRKKLKKRLEDLERRAGSSSASPEQRPAELITTSRSHQRSRSSTYDTSGSRSPSQTIQQSRSPDFFAQQYLLPSSDDHRTMFSQQATRQLSTSPPPFMYTDTVPLASSSGFSYTQQQANYRSPSQSSYGQYMPQAQQAFSTGMATFPIGSMKGDHVVDDQTSPFSVSYASIVGLDVSGVHSTYSEVAPYTPSLLDSLEFGQPDSPPDSILCPRTPTSCSQSYPLYI